MAARCDASLPIRRLVLERGKVEDLSTSGGFRVIRVDWLRSMSVKPQVIVEKTFAYSPAIVAKAQTLISAGQDR